MDRSSAFGGAAKTATRERSSAGCQLVIPSKLYGREKDIISLLESFERIGGGQGEILLIPGLSGVGKTALIQELHLPISDRNGFFISGKFDQYRQNIPYFAFRQALTELCRELQAGEIHQYSNIKSEILQAIGTQGQVLVDFVPEFEQFLGQQKPLGTISPQEARHRFADVIGSFLKVICKPEHPLVLFLDDWQWADIDSIELLKQMQVGITLRYLLVVVSYRDNEVDSGHPLSVAVNDLRSHAVPVKILRVASITVDDIQQIVADSLKPRVDDIEGLAAIINDKTSGNPFFVRSFLSFLYESSLIKFDNIRNSWQWCIEKMGGIDLPDTVVGLFVLKLHQLDPEQRTLFSLASCLGNRFDLETLSLISGRNLKECQTLLFSGQAKTLLLPQDGTWTYPMFCQFLHDRVQQAAYSLINPEELPGILLKIGRLLFSSLPPDQLSERLFEVVSDLNAGCHLVHDPVEQIKIVELNRTAARKAYTSTAYHSALLMYRSAFRFLENPAFMEELWQNHHDLTMSLYKERAECEFLEGNIAEGETFIRQSVAHAATALEKADMLTVLIVQYTLLARYAEALSAGRQALDSLGISLPDADFETARDYEIAMFRKELGVRPISSLVELPVMSDPEMLMATRILITMGPPCYRSHQRLWSVVVPKVINLTLRYGNIPQTGYSHTAFGGLLGWVDTDYAAAKEFSELATQLMNETFLSPSDHSVFYLMIGSSIRHWFKHLKYGTQDYTDAYEIGLRSGNLQYAAYAFGHNMYCQFYQGIPLVSLTNETRRSLVFSRTRRNQWAIDLLEGGLKIFGILTGDHAEPDEDGLLSENEFLKRVEDHRNIQVICIFRILKTFTLLVSGNYEDALLLSDETEPLIYTVGTQGLLPWPEHAFTRLLILTALYRKTNSELQKKWDAEIELIMSRLRIWAHYCPDNFQHKYLLADAELARIHCNLESAMQQYDRALVSAKSGNFLQWEAIINERACGFWQELGNERLAHVYWQQAYVCFYRWGAASKINSMETAYRASIAMNLPVIQGSGLFEAKPDQDNGNAFVERQIGLIRDYAFQMQQTKFRIDAAMQTDELAHALQRLRVEIAERKRAEESLEHFNSQLEKTVAERTAELKASNKELESFAYSISHDLRAPLRAMEGFSDQILGRCDAVLDSQSVHQLERIKTASRRMGFLINDLLNLSKVTRLGFHASEVDLSLIASRILGRLSLVQSTRKVQIDIMPDLIVRGDENLLSILLDHLLDNAWKFTASRAFAAISVGRIILDGEPVFYVQDNGVGFDMAYQKQLFKPFVKLDGMETSAGTGIGLVTALKIVERHGGRIWAESSPDAGATFFFTLPTGKPVR